MKILLQRKLCWLDPVPRLIMKKCSQINLLSKEGQATSVPVQLLTASSTFLNSILMISSSSCLSSPSSISLPSATSSTLKLLAQILCMGETEESGGLEMTMTNMRALQDVFVLLGLNIKLCPKLSSARLQETAPSGGVDVKEEVLESEDNQLNKKKSTVAKMSSSRGKFMQSRLLKEFKKNMMRNLTGENEIVRECDELGDNCNNTLQKKPATNTQKRSPSVLELGLLQDLKVNLVKCDTDGKKSMIKMNRSASEEGSMCNICGVNFTKFTSLRRHYRENHGIQDEKPGREVIMPSVHECSKCGLKFRFVGSLLRHLRRAHNCDRKQEIDSEKEMHYKCGEGDEKYSNIHVLLNRQSNDQHAKEIVSVSCQDCSLVLTNMKDMNQLCQEVHKKRINESIKEHVKMEVMGEDNSSKQNKKRNNCSACGKTFNYRSGSLKKHKERFHEGKTYGCGACDVIYAYKHSILRHCITKGHDKDLIYVIVDLP